MSMYWWKYMAEAQLLAANQPETHGGDRTPPYATVSEWIGLPILRHTIHTWPRVARSGRDELCEEV